MNEGFPLRLEVHRVLYGAHQKQGYTVKKKLEHLTSESEVALKGGSFLSCRELFVHLVG